MSTIPSATIAEKRAADLAGVFGRNDDARWACRPELLSMVAAYVDREYVYGCRIGIVGDGVFSIRTPDGASVFLCASHDGSVAEIEQKND